MQHRSHATIISPSPCYFRKETYRQPFNKFQKWVHIRVDITPFGPVLSISVSRMALQSPTKIHDEMASVTSQSSEERRSSAWFRSAHEHQWHEMPDLLWCHHRHKACPPHPQRYNTVFKERLASQEMPLEQSSYYAEMRSNLFNCISSRFPELKRVSCIAHISIHRRWRSRSSLSLRDSELSSGIFILAKTCDVVRSSRVVQLP